MEDPAIKLFGKKILLPATSKKNSNPPVISSAAGDEPTITGGCKDSGSDANNSQTCFEGEKVNRAAAEKVDRQQTELDNPITPSIDEETRTEESIHESTYRKPKTLKKPDKIIPCPRCTSMDTKFCYYNNYNVNQPRHFCKSCQRYWTAGGTMRNMPVGAGRRKNKNPASLSRYINASQEPLKVSNSTTKNLQLHRIPGVSWPYIPIPSNSTPVTVYPSTYWNCIPIIPPSTPTVTDSILGKRSRGEMQMKCNDCEDELSKPKNPILVPKTLRIDDPDDAARSSIWATLGIKNENFKAFQGKSKEEKKQQEMDSAMCPALHANPAAISRSLCFQETA